jgi:hypothetical protein
MRDHCDASGSESWVIDQYMKEDNAMVVDSCRREPDS